MIFFSWFPLMSYITWKDELKKNYDVKSKLIQLKREKYNKALGQHKYFEFSFRFIVSQAHGNINNAVWHISWTNGSQWNRMSSRTVYLLKCIIYKCILNFLLRTSNSFKFKFSFQCVNPTVTNFRRQSQSRDTQINVQNKLKRRVYMCNSGWVLWLVNWWVMTQCVKPYVWWNFVYFLFSLL